MFYQPLLRIWFLHLGTCDKFFISLLLEICEEQIYASNVYIVRNQNRKEAYLFHICCPNNFF